MKSLENKQNNIMNTKSTLLTAAAGVLLLAGRCQTVQALSYTGDATLVNGGTSFVVDSTALSLGGGNWSYTYDFTAPTTANEPDAFDVYFNTALAGTLSAFAGAPHNVEAGDVQFLYAGGITSGTAYSVSFDSTVAPVVGYAAAFDGGEWGGAGPGGTSFGVEVPNALPPAVPDGGLTITLLGGSLMGLQALRRKLAR
jgi:hypothetical protein